MSRVAAVRSKALQGAEGWLLVLACMVSAVFYEGCFSSPPYLVPIAGAALAGAIVAMVTTWLGTSMIRTTAWTLAALIVYLGAAVLRPSFDGWVPSSHTWTALREGTLGGWLRLLTTAAPADPTPALLMFPVLVSWWCGWTAALLSARQVGAVLAPVLPCLAAFVVALGYGAPGLDPTWWASGTFGACLLGYLVIRINRVRDDESQFAPAGPDADRPGHAAQQRSAYLGRLAYGAPSVIAVVLVGLLLAARLPWAAGTDRFDPRSLVAQPFRVSPAVTPLATIQSQLATDPPVSLFTVRSTGPRIDRIRVAALDGFDGATWTAPDDEFLPAGRVLSGDGLVEAGQRVSLDVRVATAGQSPFLPVVGEPVGLRGGGLGFSTSGSLAASSPPAAGLSYRLTSLLRPYQDLTAAARVVTSERVAVDTTLPAGMPAALGRITAAITRGATTHYAQLTALATYLRALPYDPDARPGESYGAVTRMLAKARPGDENAFAEQHAAAFVVMARYLRIPARVAVGYLVDGNALAAGKDVTVTTRDAHAWAEVPIDGYGWVPFETVNLTKTAKKVPAPAVISAPEDRTSPRTAGPAGQLGSGDPNGAGLANGIARGGLLTLWVVLALLAGYLALVLGEKRRRRWSRRRSRTPRSSVLGAWHEALDRMSEHGVWTRATWTEHETAREAHRRLDDRALAGVALAPLVSHALFAPEQPLPEAAERAWDLEGELRGDLAREVPLLRRAAAALDPRPLVPDRVRLWLSRRSRPRRSA
jgi:hypothetical protein